MQLAFEGCATRAAFHIGVARWFAERGLAWERVAGASSGSIVAAAVATDAVDALEARWFESIVHRRPFELARLMRGRWPGRMSHVLREGLEADHADLAMAETPTLRVTATRIGFRGRTELVLGPDSGLRVVDALLASCFIPGPYSRPPIHGRRLWMDGAWLCRVPLAGLATGPAVAVVSDPRGTCRQGLLRGRTRAWPSALRVLAPATPLQTSGFRFDEEASRADLMQGEQAAERFVRTNEKWLASG